MAKTKTPIKINSKTPVLTSLQKEKALLMKRAEKVIQSVKDTGLKQDFIATKVDVSIQTLSRFMNMHEAWITKSMVEKMEAFVSERNS